VEVKAAPMHAHCNIRRYRALLETRLADVERGYIERRLSEELAILREYIDRRLSEEQGVLQALRFDEAHRQSRCPWDERKEGTDFGLAVNTANYESSVVAVTDSMRRWMGDEDVGQGS